MKYKRFAFFSIFKQEEDTLEPIVPVKVRGLRIGPGMRFTNQISIMGVNFHDYKEDYDILGDKADGVIEIKAFYDLKKRKEIMTCEHEFKVLNEGWFKELGQRNSFGTIYDSSIEYSTLFCSKCGETKEIISKERKNHGRDSNDSVEGI